MHQTVRRHRAARRPRRSAGPSSGWRWARQSWSARTVPLDGERYRVVAVPAQDGQALILAQSLQPTDQMLDRLGLVMLLFGLAGMISAGLAGWAVARNGLRPVRRLTTAVEDIARTERLDPIPVEGNDEVARLALAFNAMLTALSASQARQRQLVADAGHELRTPLTSLRTNLDLLAQADASTQLSQESRKELLADVRAPDPRDDHADRRPRRAGPRGPRDPRRRAGRAGRGRGPGGHPRAPAYDDRRVRRHGPSRGGSPATRPPSSARSPTCSTTPRSGARRAGGSPSSCSQGTVMVADQGRGISDEDLPHVFDRFYRSTESRGMPGSGLGLSIVKAVADRHGGVVRAGHGTRRRRRVLVPRPRHDGAARGLGAVVGSSKPALRIVAQDDGHGRAEPLPPGTRRRPRARNPARPRTPAGAVDDYAEPPGHPPSARRTTTHLSGRPYDRSPAPSRRGPRRSRPPSSSAHWCSAAPRASAERPPTGAVTDDAADAVDLLRPAVRGHQDRPGRGRHRREGRRTPCSPRWSRSTSPSQFRRRLRLGHRAEQGRRDPDQQPRGRRRRRRRLHHGELQRRHHQEGQGHRHRPADRRRGDQGRGRLRPHARPRSASPATSRSARPSSPSARRTA